MTAISTVVRNASRSPARRRCAPAPATMTQTPAIAAALASSVARLSRSPSHTRSIAAVRNGAVAKMITTSATEVSRNALMNMIVASAEQAAATSPGSPIARTAAGASRPSWHTNTSRDEPAGK